MYCNIDTRTSGHSTPIVLEAGFDYDNINVTDIEGVCLTLKSVTNIEACD